jgi:hypothetical protein
VTGDADLAFYAIDSAGRSRNLDEGARVSLADRLVFVYGNPAGAHRQLTVLGWDGGAVHWYSPGKEGGTSDSLESGPGAIGRRLPFEVRLAGDHRAGRLAIVAGFDVDPADLASRLRTGKALDPRVRTVDVEIVAGAQ